MARTIQGSIDSMFELYHFSNRCRNNYGQVHNPNVRFLEIPITEDVFEIPLFAYNAFYKAATSSNADSIEAIVVKLDTRDYTSGYKSLDRALKDILLEKYDTSRLVKVSVKKGNDDVDYYGTVGAIFNSSFKPLMMCSFIMERYKPVSDDGDNVVNTTKYKLIRPVLRIDPEVYMSKADPMEKFIANKMIGLCIENLKRTPSNYYLNGDHTASCCIVTCEQSHLPVKVEIDSCPFSLLTADTPSISTTNQELIKVAIDHLDEIVQ